MFLSVLDFLLCLSFITINTLIKEASVEERIFPSQKLPGFMFCGIAGGRSGIVWESLYKSLSLKTVLGGPVILQIKLVKFTETLISRNKHPIRLKETTGLLSYSLRYR